VVQLEREEDLEERVTAMFEIKRRGVKSGVESSNEDLKREAGSRLDSYLESLFIYYMLGIAWTRCKRVISLYS
jgi:hypothetical protein